MPTGMRTNGFFFRFLPQDSTESRKQSLYPGPKLQNLWLPFWIGSQHQAEWNVLFAFPLTPPHWRLNPGSCAMPGKCSISWPVLPALLLYFVFETGSHTTWDCLEPPASTLEYLGLQVHTTMASSCLHFWNFTFTGIFLPDVVVQGKLDVPPLFFLLSRELMAEFLTFIWHQRTFIY
jgi:hypothetical protein